MTEPETAPGPAPESLAGLEPGQALMRDLMLVWLAFERRLAQVPIVERIEGGRVTREDYLRLLRNLRAQVVDGARWITRAASSFDADHLGIRSAVIGHAHEEHRDYALLEADYAALGGDPEEIRRAPRNIGTEALTAYMFHQASQPNPVAMLGAMFVIEGLGHRMASAWAERIREALGTGPETTRFLGYHGANDDRHMDKLRALAAEGAVTAGNLPDIVKTAKVVARLYALQLEELDNA